MDSISTNKLETDLKSRTKIGRRNISLNKAYATIDQWAQNIKDKVAKADEHLQTIKDPAVYGKVVRETLTITIYKD